MCFKPLKLESDVQQKWLGAKLVTKIFVNCQNLQKVDDFGPLFDIKLK